MARGPTYKVGPFEMWMLEGDEKICNALKRNRYWEPDVAALIDRYANPDWTFLDLGAHVGMFTLLASDIYRDVIAVEANPTAVAVLEKNVAQNDAENVEVHGVAVWDHDEGVEFVAQVANSGSSWVTPKEKPDTVRVPSQTIQQILGDRRPEVWKVDTEGAEYRVLKDVEMFQPQVILLEYSTSQLARTSEATGRMLYDVLGCYEWFRMDMSPVSFNELPAGGYDNFLLTRRN